MTPHGEASTVARVLAVARRDLLIQASYRFGSWVRLLEAVLVPITLYFMSKLVGDTPELAQYGGNYFTFALIGLVVVSFATLGLSTFSRTVADEQRGGTLEVLLGGSTRLHVVLAGAFVVPLALTGLEMLAYGSVAAALGVRVSIGAVVIALPALALTIASFCALGVLSAAFIVLSKRGDPFTLLATRATSIVAGSLFPVSVLPGWLQGFSKVVPAYYGLRSVRAALLMEAGIGDIARDLAILVAFAAVLVPLSFICFSRAVRAATAMGTLGTY